MSDPVKGWDGDVAGPVAREEPVILALADGGGGKFVQTCTNMNGRANYK
jgi:hypothetical protein